MKNKIIAWVVVGVIVVGGGSFYGGTKYGESKAAASGSIRFCPREQGQVARPQVLFAGRAGAGAGAR